MSMTLDTSQDSEALAIGFEALRNSSQLGRDLVTLWLGTTEQLILLSVETNEAAMEILRARFGGAAMPAALAWNWWAGTAAGFLGAYQETLTSPLAAPAPTAPPRNGRAPVEVDLTEPVRAEVTVGS